MLQNKISKPIFIIALLAFMLIGTVAFGGLSAQGLPVFRVGILDNPDGSLARGAALAVEEINTSGGVI